MRSKKFHVTEVLRAPGKGLLTISTGGVGEALEKFFPKNVSDAWSLELKKRLTAFKTNPPPFFILGIPSDSGGGICRGAAHGPAHLRLSLYRRQPGWENYDLGDVPCIPQLLTDSMLSLRQKKLCRKDLFGRSGAGLPVSPLDLALFVYRALKVEFPLVPILTFGGDHSISFPCFEALRLVKQTKNLAVLHIDAHTDLLERRYGIEVCFGTWTAQTLKKFPSPKNWVQLGVRASRFNKKHWEKSTGIRQYWAEEVLRLDPNEFAELLLLKWRSLGCDKLYITHDIDGTDSKFVTSTGTPEPRGLSPEWIKILLVKLTSEMKLVGSDLVEVAPVLGSDAAAQQTLSVACSYVEALSWKK